MNNKTHVLGAALIAFFIAVPSSANADIVVRSGDSVSVENDQRIDGDFYTAASTINISGEVNGDLAALAGKNTLNGTVTNDALMVGGSVDVHGSVGDDLRVIAGDVIIAEPITGDVFVLGGSVKILSTASVGGDVLIYGGNVEINGSVGGDVLGGMGTLRIDAPIAGAVDVTVGELTLGDRAVVSGSLRYVSQTTLTRAQDAKVDGEITRNDPVTPDTRMERTTVLVPVFMLLFTVLVWYLIARQFLVRIIDRALVRTIRPAATGFIALFATPVIVTILVVSVLGTLVGITALFAYLLALLLAGVSSTVVLGHLVLKLLMKQPLALTPLTLGVGVLSVSVCLFIPIIGPIILFSVMVITLGAIVDLLLRPDAP